MRAWVCFLYFDIDQSKFVSFWNEINCAIINMKCQQFIVNSCQPTTDLSPYFVTKSLCKIITIYFFLIFMIYNRNHWLVIHSCLNYFPCEEHLPVVFIINYMFIIVSFQYESMYFQPYSIGLVGMSNQMSKWSMVRVVGVGAPQNVCSMLMDTFCHWFECTRRWQECGDISISISDYPNITPESYIQALGVTRAKCILKTFEGEFKHTN